MATCYCGARIINGHHCENGHLQFREGTYMGYKSDGLTFNTLRGGNIARLPQFKNAHGLPAHSQPDGSDWSPAQWLQAIVGELGEYANIRKKFERGDIDETEFLTRACDELADVMTYLDILAFRLGIDLGTATMEKFNRVSTRVGSNVYIDNEDWHYAPKFSTRKKPE